MNHHKLFFLPAIAVEQPIGEFYVTVINSDTLAASCFADVRRLETSTTAVENYLGIQRKLDPKRKRDIAAYVRTLDATFPTSVVIAIEDQRCIEYNQGSALTNVL